VELDVFDTVELERSWKNGSGAVPNTLLIGCGVFRRTNLFFNGTRPISCLVVWSGQFGKRTVSTSKIFLI
jgi:hypothetical protein